MSDDNIINLNPPKPQIIATDDNVEERIFYCYQAAVKMDKEHQKRCIYCLHNEETGKMVFEILAKDMTLAARNKNLILTTFDMKQVLALILMEINNTEYEMAKAEETGSGRQGQDGESSGRESEIAEGSPAVTKGTGEVLTFPGKTTKD